MIDSIKKALSVPIKDMKDIIHYEGRIGGQLFGPIPEKQNREFFCLDERTWVWHEEWSDKFGRRHSTTTRYDVRPNGIFKTQGNSVYRRLSDDELLNFYEAVKLYGDKVIPELKKLANQ